MFCAKCGTQFGDDVKFCPACGSAVPSAPAAPVSGGPLADIPIKANGKKRVLFFEDHMEFDGKSLSYDNIASLYVYAMASKQTYNGIPAGKSFHGSVLMTDQNGKKHKIILVAESFFGIGKSSKKTEELWDPLYLAIYEITAKKMAEKLIGQIKNGATVEVAGLTINASQAVSKAKALKKSVTINRDNYRDCDLNTHIVAVYNKEGDAIWHSSAFKSTQNFMLVPYILDAIFG